MDYGAMILILKNQSLCNSKGLLILSHSFPSSRHRPSLNIVCAFVLHQNIKEASVLDQDPESFQEIPVFFIGDEGQGGSHVFLCLIKGGYLDDWVNYTNPLKNNQNFYKCYREKNRGWVQISDCWLVDCRSRGELM
jgi:hypothetical protein